jgi:hypothetical protein
MPSKIKRVDLLDRLYAPLSAEQKECVFRNVREFLPYLQPKAPSPPTPFRNPKNRPRTPARDGSVPGVDRPTEPA